jgi:non-ribosomal peptide synthetase component F
VQNTPPLALELAGLQLRTIAAPQELGRFELTVWVVETGAGLQVRWSYNTDLFEESRIEQMQHHYEMLLHSIVADPEKPLNELEMLTPVEKHDLLIKDRELANSAYKRFVNTELKPINVKRSAEAKDH